MSTVGSLLPLRRRVITNWPSSVAASAFLCLLVAGCSESPSSGATSTGGAPGASQGVPDGGPGDGGSGKGGSSTGGASAGGSSTGGSSTGGSGTGGSAAGDDAGGASGASTTGGSGGASGDGSQGGSDGGPPAGSCTKPQELRAGENYGEYTLFAVRLELELEPGEYTVRVDSGDDGTASVFRDGVLLGEYTYDPTAPLTVGTQQTITFLDLFELDVRSATQSDLSGLGDSVFDGCHAIVVEPPGEIVAATMYGAYLLTDVTVDDDAPSGTYTFFAESGNAGSVELRLDGAAVDTLAYDWTTSVGGDAEFTFAFPGVVSFTVARPMGYSNLFALAEALFDGRHALVVP